MVFHFFCLQFHSDLVDISMTLIICFICWRKLFHLAIRLCFTIFSNWIILSLSAKTLFYEGWNDAWIILEKIGRLIWFVVVSRLHMGGLYLVAGSPPRPPALVHAIRFILRFPSLSLSHKFEPSSVDLNFCLPTSIQVSSMTSNKDKDVNLLVRLIASSVHAVLGILLVVCVISAYCGLMRFLVMLLYLTQLHRLTTMIFMWLFASLVEPTEENLQSCL